MSETTLAEIEKIIINEINPYLELHTGSCQVSSFESNTIFLKLNGGCAGCPSSLITLYNGIVPVLKRHFPELEVELVV